MVYDLFNISWHEFVVSFPINIQTKTKFNNLHILIIVIKK